MIKKLDINRIVKILIGFSLLSISLAYLFVTALEGNVLPAVISALVSWLSYLFVHHAETGVLVDPQPEEVHVPNEEKDFIIFALSIFLLVAGMFFGSIGVSEGKLIEASLGAAILLTGYFVAHYELTGHIV